MITIPKAFPYLAWFCTNIAQISAQIAAIVINIKTKRVVDNEFFVL